MDEKLYQKWTAHFKRLEDGDDAIASFGADPSAFDSLVAFAKKYGQTLTQAVGLAPGFQSTRASVVQSFVDWSHPLEGYLPYMYTDAKGLVTTGMGNLIDPVSLAHQLPWKKSDGSLASSSEVDAEFAKIKGAYPAVQSVADAKLATLHLDKADIEKLVSGKMRENDAYLSAHLPGFAAAPADAQLAAHSMAWAMGPGFASTWTQFRQAFGAGDYLSAADQSHMRGVGIDMRNLANKLLLTNAAAVKRIGADFDRLFYVDGLTALARGAATSSSHALLAAGGALASQGAHAAESARAHPLVAVGLGLAGLGLVAALWPRSKST